MLRRETFGLEDRRSMRRLTWEPMQEMISKVPIKASRQQLIMGINLDL